MIFLKKNIFLRRFIVHCTNMSNIMEDVTLCDFLGQAEACFCLAIAKSKVRIFFWENHLKCKKNNYIYIFLSLG